MLSETLRAPTAASAARETTAMMIETRGLTKTFKARGKTVEAVRGVDLRCGGRDLRPPRAERRGQDHHHAHARHAAPTHGGEAGGGYDLLREPDKVRHRIGYVSQSGGAAGRRHARESGLAGAALRHERSAMPRPPSAIVALELDRVRRATAQTYSGGSAAGSTWRSA